MFVCMQALLALCLVVERNPARAMIRDPREIYRSPFPHCKTTPGQYQEDYPRPVSGRPPPASIRNTTPGQYQEDYPRPVSGRLPPASIRKTTPGQYQEDYPRPVSGRLPPASIRKTTPGQYQETVPDNNPLITTP